MWFRDDRQYTDTVCSVREMARATLQHAATYYKTLQQQHRVKSSLEMRTTDAHTESKKVTQKKI